MSHSDGIHADVNRLHGDAGVETDHIFDLAHNGAADSGDVDAVLHHDVQLDGNGMVIVVRDLDALAHGLRPKQMDQTVRHAALCHALTEEERIEFYRSLSTISRSLEAIVQNSEE